MVSQLVTWEIAPPEGEVRWDISKDVYPLEPLSESDALPQQVLPASSSRKRWARLTSVQNSPTEPATR